MFNLPSRPMTSGVCALATAFALIVPALASDAEAAPSGVGLGAAAGVAIPDGDLDYKATFSWGFFVDIPLISTFHITPSTLVYDLKPSGSEVSVSATDVSLSFKFMIPLGPIDPFVGVLAGLTSAQDLEPHVGLLAGTTVRLLPNIDAYLQANYRLILRDEGGNVRDLMIHAGPLFRF
ncbi:MAG: hypothetical protein IPK13_08800 [Deltaproteobacteria bacterium]|nr:hypothetical protein [Deltaproteobacteria bacterium]